MKKTKVLSLLLALVMVFSMLPAASAADFNDVNADDWFAGAVEYVVANNLMGGYNATSFGPNDNLSRAMVVQVLYNKEGQPAISGKHEFTDVPADQWFNNAVTWGTQKGVMGGYGNGKFGPNDNVTLEQIAVILWNYSGNPTFIGSAESLGAHSGWAANGLGWAAEKGILTNVPYQAVTEAATRAQTAQMLTNYLSDNSGIADGIAVTSVSLDLTSHTMGEGWTQSLTATVSPADATNTTITWSSSDPKIATVDQNGKVTGVSGGTATITAKSANGKTATCTVKVWHDHKLVSSKPVTCTDGGLEVYTCSGCGHSYESWTPAPGTPHTWKNATCDAPKTCTTCGTTSGDPANHKWTAATCTAPKTCSACKATDGTPLGHVAGKNNKCTRCGKDATIDMKTKISAPTERFAMLRGKNSVGLVELNWTANNNSGKTIKYYSVTGYYYNAVGDPAKNDITGKTSYTVKYVGPVEPGGMLLVSDFGYCSLCREVVLGEITLEYTDGTTDTGWYGYRISGF